MCFCVHRTQPLGADPRVALGRGQARVAEQFLDNTQVSATVEQMRRERVPKRVGMDWRGRSVGEDPADLAWINSRAFGAHQEVVGLRREGTARPKPAREHVTRGGRERHQSLFVAFAGDGQH